MGQNLSYRAGEALFRHRISRADWQLVQELRKHLPEEAELVFFVPQLGDEVEVLTSALRSAVQRMALFIDSRPDLLPHTYQFKYERSLRPGIPPGGFGTGALSGLRLSGDDEHFYFIRAGLNECFLEKNAIGPDGKGHAIERRDVRGVSELQTTNVGRISIRRIRSRTELRKVLGDIAKFVDVVTAREVVKSVV